MPDFPQFAGVVNTSNIENLAVTTAKIADAAVTNAKLADMAAHAVKMRKTNSTGAPEDATLLELLALLGGASVGVSGVATFTFFSAVIDLKAAPASYQIIPPTAARIRSLLTIAELKATSAPTVAPTFSVGSNSTSFNDFCASQTPAAFTTQAAETWVSLTSANPQPAADITTSGVRVNITNAASATTLTARFLMSVCFLPV